MKSKVYKIFKKMLKKFKNNGEYLQIKNYFQQNYKDNCNLKINLKSYLIKKKKKLKKKYFIKF